MHALLEVNFYYYDSYYVAKLMGKSKLYCNQEFTPLLLYMFSCCNLVNDEHSGLTVLLKWSVVKLLAQFWEQQINSDKW